MNTSTSQAYEASIQNAAVKISNSEWVNEFSQGIELKKGDSVRLLGSFVNEQSNGEEIEVTDEMSVNIEYSPFIKGQTFFTADKSTDLIKLGRLGDLAYSTDAFGIEPPGFWWSTGQNVPTKPDPIVTPATDVPTSTNIATNTWSFNCQQNNLFKNVFCTGTSSLHFNTNGAQWRSQNNEAITWGTNISTYDKKGNANSSTKNTVLETAGGIYNDFANFSCTNELYIAELCKKFILPVINTLDTQHCYGGVNLSTLEPLLNDPPTQGPTCLGGVPKPGMLITTIDIGFATGFYDDDGNAYFQAGGHTHGQPNLMNGPQSVIGTILAVRPIYRVIRGNTIPCYEIYVYDWVNPGKYRSRNIRRENLDATHFRLLRSETRQFANLFTGQPQITLTTQVHGAGELENGYNTNSSSNNINGCYNQATTTFGAGSSNNQNQMMAGIPDFYNFNTTASSGTNKFGLNGDLFEQSCLDSNVDDFKKGFAKSQGLSFLWNGTYGGQHRRAEFTPTAPNFGAARGNNNMIFDSTNQRVTMSYFDTDENDTPGSNPGSSLDALNPSCFGAFIICKKETMIDIINGVYTNIDDGRGDGYQSRIWLDYSYQVEKSGYGERHYEGNSFTQTNFSPPGTNGYDSVYQSPVASVPAGMEYRYNVEMIGKPQSQNWRKIGYPGNSEPYNTDGLNLGMGDFQHATTRGPVDTIDPNYVGDGSNNIMSTQKGFNDNQWVNSTIHHGHLGCPFQNATYETSVNSIYFQDKSTGDVELGMNTETGTYNGDYVYYTLQADLPAGSVAGTPFNIADQSTSLTTPVIDHHIWVNFVNGFTSSLVKITNVVTIAPGLYTIQIDNDSNVLIPQGTTFRMSPTTSGSISGAGTQAIPWVSDLLILRTKTAKYYVEPGFYTEEQLANEINDRLHDTNIKYKNNFGDSNGAIPTNIGIREQNYPSQNTAVLGNFVHTYLPDLNYAFTPVTSDNATDLDLTESTKEMTNQLITYEPQQDGGGNWIYYFEGEFPAYNGTTNRYIVDHSTNYPSISGKKTKLYSVPFLNKKEGKLNPQVHLFRLKGGALNYDDADITPAEVGPPAVPAKFNKWDLKDVRFAGFYEGLRDLRTQASAENPTNEHSSGFSFIWRTRLNRNLLNYGGSAKLFIGANNLTLSFVEEVQKYSLNNLYTPLRPSLSENPTKQDFGVDDATPSAIIGAELTGQTEDMLSGIYIDKLVGNAFTQENFGIRWYENVLYDTNPENIIQQYGTNFWTTLGYTENQLSLYNNSFDNVGTPYVFNGLNLVKGSALRVGSKITPAVNGTNPFANNCTLINPVQQYFVEVDSDDFFAKESPTKGTDPYYYIGSDFPTKQFFGNDTGEKLPVIGICARNFHSFNFAFDLGASAISYTIDEDVTITSIRTAIYRNNLKAPTNLSRFSSIIYLITKANYYNPLPEQFDQQKGIMIQQNYSAPYNPYFYNPAPYQYRSQPPPIIPKNYYKDEGTIPVAQEEDDSDLD